MALIVEFEEAAGVFLGQGPGIEIAGDGTLAHVGEEIEALAGADRAAHDGVGEAHQPQALVLLGEARDFRLDGLIGLRVERALGVPIGEGDQRARR